MHMTHFGSGIWSYTRRTIGAIFNVTVPATMIRSDCRGLGRKMPAPKRSISNREAPVAIISIAQQARPKVIGHRADLRAQLKTKSTVVVMMFFSNRSSIHAGIHDSVFSASRPIQGALLNNPNISHDQNTKKYEHFGEPEQREFPVNNGPGKKEDGFNVEDDEQDGDNVITDRVTLAGIGIGVHA